MIGCYEANNEIMPAHYLRRGTYITTRDRRRSAGSPRRRPGLRSPHGPPAHPDRAHPDRAHPDRAHPDGAHPLRGGLALPGRAGGGRGRLRGPVPGSAGRGAALGQHERHQPARRPGRLPGGLRVLPGGIAGRLAGPGRAGHVRREPGARQLAHAAGLRGRAGDRHRCERGHRRLPGGTRPAAGRGPAHHRRGAVLRGRFRDRGGDPVRVAAGPRGRRGRPGPAGLRRPHLQRADPAGRRPGGTRHGLRGGRHPGRLPGLAAAPGQVRIRQPRPAASRRGRPGRGASAPSRGRPRSTPRRASRRRSRPASSTRTRRRSQPRP